jgi:hypothetical protein
MTNAGWWEKAAGEVVKGLGAFPSSSRIWSNLGSLYFEDYR